MQERIPQCLLNETNIADTEVSSLFNSYRRDINGRIDTSIIVQIKLKHFALRVKLLWILIANNARLFSFNFNFKAYYF